LIRSEHFWYDLRELLGNIRVLLGMVVFAVFFVLFVSFSFVYLFILLFGALLTARALIGRRCPHCDAELKETSSEGDKKDAFIMYIIWRCPNDGYEEKEKVKGDSGLFGAG
jgi:hypothetical protein